MKLVQDYQRFSFIGLSAWMHGAARAERPQPIVAELPPDLRAELIARLTPVAERLEAARLDAVANADAQLRVLLPGAVAVGLFFGLSGGSVIAFLLVSLLLLVLAFLLVDGRTATQYRAAAKGQVTGLMASFLSGFRYEPDAALGPAAVDRWKLLPEVRGVVVEDRLLGHRDGRQVAISRLTITLGPPSRRKAANDGVRLAVTAVEMDLPWRTTGGATVAIGRDSGSELRGAPRARHGLRPAPVGDATFDERYLVHAEEPRLVAPDLNAGVRAGLPRVEAECRSGTIRLAQLMPGAQGERPMLSIQAGYAVVLFPRPLDEPVLEPGPHWRKLDLEATLTAFASDLARLNHMLGSAMALPFGKQETAP
ncbi:MULTISPECIES: hypothetical protein [Roseomonadaceae]|uniref:DUF3137 domain-containing protein n=1 Tax=Falsiroseomonas oleicola TaxID=2801474 RepID=A0ABS6HGH7_9PROT|nr:hypothetical protein [Roseomonas oleicola]MBU8547063.1 hypothetical protein [Roseomonas oleicola]